MELHEIIGIAVVTCVLSIGTFFICLRCCRSLLDVSADYKRAPREVTFPRYLGDTIRQSFRGVRSSFRRIGSLKKQEQSQKNPELIRSKPTIDDFWRERSIIHPSYLSKKGDSDVMRPSEVLNKYQPVNSTKEINFEDNKSLTANDGIQGNNHIAHFVSIEDIISTNLLDIDQQSCSSGDTLILDGSMTPQLNRSKQCEEGEYEEVGPPRFENNGTIEQSVVMVMEVSVSEENTNKDQKHHSVEGERTSMLKNLFKLFTGKKSDKKPECRVSQDKHENLEDANISSLAHPNPSEENLVSRKDNMQKTLSTNESFSKETSSVLTTRGDVMGVGDRKKENIEHEAVNQTKNVANNLENVKNSASDDNIKEMAVQSSVLKSEIQHEIECSAVQSLRLATVSDSHHLMPTFSTPTGPAQSSAKQATGTKTRSSIRDLKAKRKQNNRRNLGGPGGVKNAREMAVDSPRSNSQIVGNTQYEDVAPPSYYDVLRPPGGDKGGSRQIHETRNGHPKQLFGSSDKHVDRLQYHTPDPNVSKSHSFAVSRNLDQVRYQTASLPSQSRQGRSLSFNNWSGDYWEQNRHRPAPLPGSLERTHSQKEHPNYGDHNLYQANQCFDGKIVGHNLQQPRQKQMPVQTMPDRKPALHIPYQPQRQEEQLYPEIKHKQDHFNYREKPFYQRQVKLGAHPMHDASNERERKWHTLPHGTHHLARGPKIHDGHFGDPFVLTTKRQNVRLTYL